MTKSTSATQWSAGAGALRRLLAATGPLRLWLLAGVLATGTVAVLLATNSTGIAIVAPFALPWWLVAIGYAAAEVFVVHLPFRRDTQSFSLSEVPFVVGLFFLTPNELLLALLAGTGATLVLHRRQAPIKLVFNLSTLAFAGTVGILVFRVISALGDPFGPIGWLAASAAAISSDVISVVLIGVAVRVATGHHVEVIRVAGLGAMAAFFNSCLALVAVTVFAFRPDAGVLPLILTVLLVASYRLYGSVRQQSQSMEILHDATRLLHQATDLDAVVGTTLVQGRDLFRADVAELLMLDDGDERAWAARLDSDAQSAPTRTATALDPGGGVWARVAAEGTGLVLPRPISNPRLATYFGARGIHDLVVAPLFDADRVVGTITVANRIGPLSFDADDLRLLQTFANHASSSLENARLIDRLRRQADENRYQALHDSLTGLPNRLLFRAQVDEQLGARGHPGFAIALMDLNHFKDINDTLGHTNGDLLLISVAERLKREFGADHVARLGGDEFCLLIEGISDLNTADGAAQRLRDLLSAPFDVGDLSLEIDASVGVAICPRHGDTFEMLMQRADVAMYQAKTRFQSHVVYDAANDPYDPDRLHLIADLRRAIDSHQLTVMYQPQQDVSEGSIVAAEALVRWFHPIRGAIPPDVFIPIAEHTSLLKPLTMFVLRTAVDQCALWRAAGYDMSVSVNLSVRNLLDPDLPDDVDAALRAAKLPAHALELEITESALIADPVRSLVVLHRLRALGVGISIDDYGTGYSSLAYIRRMPIDEIKLDKSFVLGMANDESDALMVESTLDLGHRLGLRVVAEGVETQSILHLLAESGCDRVQGYYIGRPQTAGVMTRSLARRKGRDAPAQRRTSGRRDSVGHLHVSS